MGIALGCVGMSMDDFCRCTPSQFRAIYNTWSQQQHLEWERARIGWMFAVLPYSKKTDPRKIWPFKWDKESGNDSTKQESTEDIKKKYKEQQAKLGLH